MYFHPHSRLCQSLILVRSHVIFSLPTMHDILDSGFLLESINQATGASIMSFDVSALFQFSLDLLGQGLAKLNPPLIEAVDIPDGTFREGQMFIVGDQGPESAGSNLLGENRSGRSIAEESFVGNELGWGAFCFYFFRGFANHQGFSLGEEVGG